MLITFRRSSSRLIVRKSNHNLIVNKIQSFNIVKKYYVIWHLIVDPKNSRSYLNYLYLKKISVNGSIIQKAFKVIMTNLVFFLTFFFGAFN